MRGGAEQFMDETERSLHDAIMIVRRAIKNDAVVAGGGAIELELSKYLREYSRSIAGKEQLLIAAMAKALEIIPRQLCDNAGFDATNILNKLRQKHAQGKRVLSWPSFFRFKYTGPNYPSVFLLKRQNAEKLIASGFNPTPAE